MEVSRGHLSTNVRGASIVFEMLFPNEGFYYTAAQRIVSLNISHTVDRVHPEEQDMRVVAVCHYST